MQICILYLLIKPELLGKKTLEGFPALKNEREASWWRWWHSEGRGRRICNLLIKICVQLTEKNELNLKLAPS